MVQVVSIPKSGASLIFLVMAKVREGTCTPPGIRELWASTLDRKVAPKAPRACLAAGTLRHSDGLSVRQAPDRQISSDRFPPEETGNEAGNLEPVKKVRTGKAYTLGHSVGYAFTQYSKGGVPP